jgi:hypothetical protein
MRGILGGKGQKSKRRGIDRWKVEDEEEGEIR